MKTIRNWKLLSGLVILVALIFVLLPESAADAGSTPHTEATTGVVPGSPERSSEAPPVTVSPFRALVPHRVVDALSGKVLTPAALRVRGTEASVSPNRAGAFALRSDDAAYDVAIGECWYPAERRTATHQLAIPFLAAVDISVDDDTEGTKGDSWQVTLVGLPRIPEGTPRAVRRYLDMLSLRDPEAYLRRVGVPGCREVVTVPVGETVRASMPWDGEVRARVSVSDDLVVRAPAVRVTRGEATPLRIRVCVPPSVSGRVIGADGVPVSGAKVNVTCSSEFGGGDEVPPQDGTRAALAVTNEVAGGPQLGECQALATTGADGSFLVRVPFTDRVLCTSFRSGCARAMQVSQAGSRFATVRDVVLFLPPVEEGARGARLVGEDGPLGDLEVFPVEVTELGQLQYPSRRSDGNGVVSLADAPVGTRLHLVTLAHPRVAVTVPARGVVDVRVER